MGCVSFDTNTLYRETKSEWLNDRILFSGDNLYTETGLVETVIVL